MAQKEEDFDPKDFLWAFMESAAAPLDMNDSDEYHKAEPPSPRNSHSARRTPPKTFQRTRPLSETHVETHEEMRLRILLEFLKTHYPQNGKLDAAALSGEEDFRQVALLLKYGILGEGRQLKNAGFKLKFDLHKEMYINGTSGELQGPETTLEEVNHNG